MNWNEYGAFIIEETKNLLAIDSPSGMTKKAAEHVAARFEALGYAPQTTRKDGVLVCLGGRDRENGLLLEAHMDTLGGMVCQIKANGRLKITPIGGLRAENVETENCRVVTKFDGVIEGTAQLINASTHVNEKYADTQRTFDTVEIVLDEPVDGLDPVMRRQVWSLILQDVAERGTTVLVSSHNLRELEDVCDHVGVMSRGKLLLEHSLSELQDYTVKLQLAFEGAELPELPQEIKVLHHAQTGRVHTLICRGSAEELEQQLAALHPIFIDAVPLSLEEIFIYELGGEDYAIRDIVL